MVWTGTSDIQSSSVPGNAQLVEQNEGLGIVLDTVMAVAGEEWSAANYQIGASETVRHQVDQTI